MLGQCCWRHGCAPWLGGTGGRCGLLTTIPTWLGIVGWDGEGFLRRWMPGAEPKHRSRACSAVNECCWKYLEWDQVSQPQQVPGKGRMRKGHCISSSAGWKLGWAGAIPDAFPDPWGLGADPGMRRARGGHFCCASCYTEGSQTRGVKPPPSSQPTLCLQAVPVQNGTAPTEALLFLKYVTKHYTVKAFSLLN